MTLGRYRLLSALDCSSVLSRKWQNRTRASRSYSLRPTFVQTALNLPRSKRTDQRSPNLSFARMASCSSKESGGKSVKKNRLSSEKSPYLQQHATNPVDWYPWCDEALRKAKNEDKCIFLSVGYSTCHWCHVMEKESFVNKEIAEIMNQHFVNIKVDKEERPDIDRVYMTFIQARTGHGGWPMSLFLTPDLKPILGGTYFPPEDTFRQTGFKRILINIAQKWKQSREKIADVGSVNMEFLQSVSEIPYSSKSGEVPRLECSDTCFEQLSSEFEPTYGGFGSKYNMQSPKFPQTVNFNFLFHLYARESKGRSELAQRCLHMCVHTLKKMAQGGIHDHVGQGFARYATDGEWHVPHFEKMLYDQGQLMRSYADGYVATKDDLFAEIVHDIAAYVSNNLRHKEGGFYSAEDADSYPESGASEKKEGAFYVWSETEIKSLLNKEVGGRVKLSDVFCQHFNVKDSGNVNPYQDPHGQLAGKNVLIMHNDVEETAKQFNLTAEETRAHLKEACSILFRVRSERPPPDTDYKIITAWNGIMISGLAAGGAAVNNKEYIEYAEDAAKFIKRYLFDEKENLLLHCCYRDEKDNITQLSTPIAAFLDDYALLVKGLLDLYESSLNEEWLEFAERLQDLQDRLFWDETGGGYFATAGNDYNIIPRVKEVYDGAIPSGNSIAAENLLRLADYLNRGELKAKAGRVFQAFSQVLTETPTAVPQMISALVLYYDDFTQIYVAGKRAAKDTDDLLRVIYKRLIPGRILLLIDHDDASSALLRKNEHLANVKPVNGQATAYVCKSRTCSLPVTTPQQLATLLDEKR